MPVRAPRQIDGGTAFEHAHSIYARSVLDCLNGRGISPSALLAKAGLEWHDLSQGRHIDPSTFQSFVAHALHRSGEPALGVMAGLMLQPYHSPVGIGAVTSGTVGEGLRFLCRHAQLLYGNVEFRFENAAPWSVLEVRITRPLHEAHEFVSQFIIGAHCRLLEAMCGRPVDELVVGLPYARPPGGDVSCSRYVRRVEFDCACLRFKIPAALTRQACVSANAEEFRDAAQACRRIDAELARGQFSQRVQRALAERLAKDPGAGELAAHLGISVRTMARQLAEGGTTYSDLKDQLRKTQATWYLKHTELSIEAIASRLGYTELANFSRAFRRWHCVSPRKMRQSMRSSDDGAPWPSRHPLGISE